MKTIYYTPASEEYDRLIDGVVLANRIADICAKPNTKRYRQYLKLIQDQFMNQHTVDPAAQYREEAKMLVPNALAAYEKRHGISVVANQLYFYRDDDFKIAAAPDAVEPGFVGLTVHVRQTPDTYDKAVADGITSDMERHAQAMMLVTELPYWIHLDYWEDAELRKRKLYEHPIYFNRRHATELEHAMISFVSKSRFRAAA